MYRGTPCAERAEAEVGLFRVVIQASTVRELMWAGAEAQLFMYTCVHANNFLLDCFTVPSCTNMVAFNERIANSSFWNMTSQAHTGCI